MNNKRKILIIAPFEGWPLSQGSIVRTYYFVHYLAQQYQLWYVCRGPADKHAAPSTVHLYFTSPHRFLQLFNPVLVWRLWRLIRREQIDGIIVSHFWSVLHGVCLKWLTRKPLLFDNHNVEHVRFRRMGSWLWPIIGLLEWIACKTADQILTVSSTDKTILAHNLRLPSDKFQVVPNGAVVEQLLNQPVDVTKIRRQLELQPKQNMVLFFGTLRHQPNRQAVDTICTILAPMLADDPYIQIVIAGYGNLEYRDQLDTPPTNVHFVGFQQDIGAVIRSADVVIAPLTAGSGTRFKIIEVAAAGRTIISTTIGAEGLEPACFGSALIIEDQWQPFADRIREYATKPRQWEPSAAFREQYDWQHIFTAIDWENLLQ